MVTSRLIVLLMVLLGMGGYLVYTIFQLQIVNGENYFNNFRSGCTLPCNSSPAGGLITVDMLQTYITLSEGRNWK